MSYSRKLQKHLRSGIYIGPTQSMSSPKNSRRACLCTDGKTYSTKCCDGYLINQGIGNVESVYDVGAFSEGFSNGFDITTKS